MDIPDGDHQHRTPRKAGRTSVASTSATGVANIFGLSPTFNTPPSRGSPADVSWDSGAAAAAEQSMAAGEINIFGVSSSSRSSPILKPKSGYEGKFSSPQPWQRQSSQSSHISSPQPWQRQSSQSSHIAPGSPPPSFSLSAPEAHLEESREIIDSAATQQQRAQEIAVLLSSPVKPEAVASPKMGLDAADCKVTKDLDGCIVELCAADFACGAVLWHNRVPGQPDAKVPDAVKFDAQEKAFIFPLAGEVITVPVATNPTILTEVSYAVWAKVLGELPEGNLAWIVGQTPDYGWSRALTLNDWRLGHVSITTSTYWDSFLGRAPKGSWIHVVGVWRQYGSCTVYLNGKRGATITAHNGRGHDPAEALVIGGRASGDPNHNAPVAISDVSVYDRVLSNEEVSQLFRRGRNSRAPASNGVPQKTEGEKDCGARSASSEALEGVQGGLRQVHHKGPPVWDEHANILWYATGVNAYDLPDGYTWQREFKALVEKSTPGAEARLRRTLQPQYASDPEMPPPSPLPPRGRRLQSHLSDPERHEKRVAHTKALRQMPTKAGFAIRVHDHMVAFFRFRNRVFAVDAKCPHQGGSLVDGEIGDIEDMVEGERCFVTCPVHKFQFDLSSGAVLQGKCGELATYAVRLVKAENDMSAAMIEVGFQSLADDYFADFEVDDF